MITTGHENVHVQVQDAIATVTVDRPEKLNALDAGILEALASAAHGIASRPRAEIGGVILTGAGDRAFIAGADIAQMAGMDPEAARRFAALGQSVPEAWERLDRPVIAAVGGYALGGGCEMAMGADLIFATESARFGQPELSLGLIPCFGGCVRLPRWVGLPRARELILTGRTFTAHEAREWGMVTAILPDRDQLLEAARGTLRRILDNGPQAVAAAKEALRITGEDGPHAGLAAERDLFGRMMTTEDMREGTAAFLEKRRARFVDR